MRMLAKERTFSACEKLVAQKIKEGWKAITPVKLDDSYIGGRYVCVLEKPDKPGKKPNVFNQYMGR